jgi:hypothetical protein
MFYKHTSSLSKSSISVGSLAIHYIIERKIHKATASSRNCGMMGTVKRKAEYTEGPEASANFERAMRGLFQIPKGETPPRPKREKARKKTSRKTAH